MFLFHHVEYKNITERKSFTSMHLRKIVKEHNLNGKKYCKHPLQALLRDQTQCKETSATGASLDMTQLGSLGKEVHLFSVNSSHRNDISLLMKK